MTSRNYPQVANPLDSSDPGLLQYGDLSSNIPTNHSNQSKSFDRAKPPHHKKHHKIDPKKIRITNANLNNLPHPPPPAQSNPYPQHRRLSKYPDTNIDSQKDTFNANNWKLNEPLAEFRLFRQIRNKRNKHRSMVAERHDKKTSDKHRSNSTNKNKQSIMTKLPNLPLCMEEIVSSGINSETNRTENVANVNINMNMNLNVGGLGGLAGLGNLGNLENLNLGNLNNFGNTYLPQIVQKKSPFVGGKRNSDIHGFTNSGIVQMLSKTVQRHSNPKRNLKIKYKQESKSLSPTSPSSKSFLSPRTPKQIGNPLKLPDVEQKKKLKLETERKLSIFEIYRKNVMKRQNIQSKKKLGNSFTKNITDRVDAILNKSLETTNHRHRPIPLDNSTPTHTHNILKGKNYYVNVDDFSEQDTNFINSRCSQLVNKKRSSSHSNSNSNLKNLQASPVSQVPKMVEDYVKQINKNKKNSGNKKKDDSNKIKIIPAPDNFEKSTINSKGSSKSPSKSTIKMAIDLYQREISNPWSKIIKDYMIKKRQRSKPSISDSKSQESMQNTSLKKLILSKYNTDSTDNELNESLATISQQSPYFRANSISKESRASEEYSGQMSDYEQMGPMFS